MTENEAIKDLDIIRFNPHWDELVKEEYWQELMEMSMNALEEVQQYRVLGTPEDLKAMKEHGAFTGVELATIFAVQMKLKEYEAIGTLDACRAAMEKQTETLTVDKAKTIAAKAICIGCGYLADCKCDYNGGNCMVSKPMLESVLKSFDDWNRRASDGTTD